MNSTVYGLSIDAADAEKLAHFRAEALGRDITSGASTESAALAPDATTPRLSFHQVAEPKSVKNRLHLDLISNTFEAESQRCHLVGRLRCARQVFTCNDRVGLGPPRRLGQVGTFLL
jgi:hypothetical protein